LVVALAAGLAAGLAFGFILGDRKGKADNAQNLVEAKALAESARRDLEGAKSGQATAVAERDKATAELNVANERLRNMLATAKAQGEATPRKDEPPASNAVEERKGMTLAAYLAQRPDGPAEITVRCELKNYYNWAYERTAASHYSVSLKGERPFKSGHAWVPKNSNVGKQVFEVLKDGHEHRLTLRLVLAGPDGTPTPPEREDMAIVELVR
jgi:hypothetical protein